MAISEPPTSGRKAVVNIKIVDFCSIYAIIVPQMLPEINSSPARPEGLKKSLLFMVTQSEFGGAQRFLFELLSRLDRSRYDLSLAVGITGDKSFVEAVRGLNIPIYILPALSRDAMPFHDIRSIFEIRTLIQKIKPDTLVLKIGRAHV